VQLFRTLCVVAVLGALTYGAYVTLTGSPPVEPPLDALNFDSPPTVVLPGAAPTSTAGAKSSLGGGATAPAPKFAGGPGSLGAARLNAPTDSLAGTPLKPTITNVRPNSGSPAQPPANYPTTNAIPGSFDGAGTAPMRGGYEEASPSTVRADGPQLPGVSLSSADGSAAPLVTPAVGTSANNVASLIGSPYGSSSAVPFDEIQALAASRPAEALEKLSRWFDDPTLPPEVDARVQSMLDQLAGSVVYSTDHVLEPAHIVQSGERLEQIAARYEVPPQLLAKINGLADPANLTAGTQLKVVQGPFAALVDKSRRQLTVFLGPLYAGSFPVGFGQDRPPVDGQYAVIEKAYDRHFPARGGMPYTQTGIPTHWLDLGNGHVLHTDDGPEPLDNDNATGCVRISSRDSGDVFDILTVGSQVIIRP